MPNESLVEKVKERAAALGKPPARRLHDVIAALKTAAELTEAPQEAVERIDPDFSSNLKKLDVLNKARSRIRARKRRKVVPVEPVVKEAAEFINPFPGLTPDKKISIRELARSVRVAIAAEHEAVHLYESIVDATDNAQAADLLQDIADEEKVHLGELQKLLESLQTDERKFLDKGREEAK